MTSSPSRTRRAGILVPLFSIPSARSWGIGEIGDLDAMTTWLEHAGQRALLMLPINEMPLHESSPYSALSAMAIDPQFITLDLVEDFAAIGGEASLEPEWRARLDSVRSSRAIDYVSVRELKHVALRRSFEHFQRTEWKGDSHRAARFRAYIEDQAWWLDDYALFRALHAHHGERAWTEWPQPIRDRHLEALVSARVELDEDVQYPQVRAVDRGRAVGDRAVAREGRRLVRRSPLCRERRQRGRLDATGRVQAGRVGWRAAGRLQRDGTELGTSRLPVGRADRAGLPLAAATRPAERRPVRRLPCRSPGRASTGCMSGLSRVARGRSRRPCRPSRWRSANAC